MVLRHGRLPSLPVRGCRRRHCARHCAYAVRQKLRSRLLQPICLSQTFIPLVVALAKSQFIDEINANWRSAELLGTQKLVESVVFLVSPAVGCVFITPEMGPRIKPRGDAARFDSRISVGSHGQSFWAPTLRAWTFFLGLLRWE
jgi:hypothetical protein